MPIIVEVSARILHWPNACACCGGAASTSIPAATIRRRGKRVVRTESKWWRIPYCHDCRAHTRHSHGAIGSFQLASTLALIAGICALLNWNIWAGFFGVAVIAAAVGAIFTRQSLGASCSRCVSYSPAVRYLGWYGTIHSFEFDNRDFAEAFIKQNRAKVISVNESRSSRAAPSIGASAATTLVLLAGVVIAYIYIPRGGEKMRDDRHQVRVDPQPPPKLAPPPPKAIQPDPPANKADPDPIAKASVPKNDPPAAVIDTLPPPRIFDPLTVESNRRDLFVGLSSLRAAATIDALGRFGSQPDTLFQREAFVRLKVGQFAAKHKLSGEQLAAIEAEGLAKGWPKK